MRSGGESLPRESGAAEACPGDGELVALLDDALEGGRALDVRAHLADCPSCRSRMGRLRERDDAVRSWLVRHDPAPPPPDAYAVPGIVGASRRPPADPPRRGHPSRYRRWAAAAVLVLLAGVLAGPARGWVGDRLEGLLDPDPQVSPTVEIPSDVSPATSFVPSGTRLDVVFEGRPADGTLVIDRGGDALVTVRVPPGVGLRVQAGRVMVGGPAPAAGEYRLTVPPDLDRVVVRVPGAEPVEIDLGDGPMPRRVPLDGAAAPLGGT